MSEQDLVAMHEIPPEGIPYNTHTRKAKNPKQQSLLEDHSEKYEGVSPLAMGLLQAGASMMRNSGWRNKPMTTSEMIGHAIPAGIGGYYNQDVRNQQEETNFIAQQQAKQQQDLALAQTQSMIAQLDTIDSKLLNREQKRILKSQLLAGGKIAEEASKKIMEILTQKRAGEPYLHKELGWVQEDKDGKIEVLKENQKDFKGSPLGTFQIGTEEANKVLTSHGITNVPEGTVYIDAKPITLDKKILGSHLVFKDEKGDELETEDVTDSNGQVAEYISAEEFKKKEPNWVLPDKTKNVARDKTGKILGYQIEDADGITYLGAHEKSWQQAQAQHSILSSELMNVGKFKQLEVGKDINIPAGTVNVKWNKKTGDIEFLNEQNNPVADPTTTVLALQDEQTKDLNYWVVDKNTGKKIKKIDLKEMYETPVERLRFNMEQKEKANLGKNVDDLLDDLRLDHGVDDNMIGYLKTKSLIDPEGAITEINNLYTQYYAQGDNIKSGTTLLGKFGQNAPFEADLYYRLEGDRWVEYRPHSSERLGGEAGIRKEYNQLTRDHRIASRGYDGIMSGLKADSGFGDIMAITSFRIMFEPNSVVREAEFEITANAGGWLEKFLNNPDQFMDGDRLSPVARQQMHTLVQDYMKAIQKRSDKHYNTYNAIAEKAGYKNTGIVDVFADHNFDIKYQDYISTGESDNIRKTINKGDNAVTLTQMIRQRTAGRKKKKL
jgi:hypothetical protein